ncbi:unnamed protein product [Polarella glacialis]|uniref:CAAX prenyl protease 2/Lysostaphin resistance protein A-like domain-containing protein n=1 Tax=Polarella glacialis TaxID=89957 RepID=A0A813KJZ0_POLGL|nr:unnamed protein product [Polarella glacialis]
MAEEGRGDHLLAAALRVWGDIRGELKVHEGEALQNGILLPAEDLKKVVKWLQQTVTKFGASAAVADGEDRDKMLQPIAQEVIKSFTAAVGTLLSMRRGAGPSLVKELQVVGGSLAEAIDALGASVGSPSMATHAGKALERVKHLEKMSVQNRAAVRPELRAIPSVVTLAELVALLWGKLPVLGLSPFWRVRFDIGGNLLLCRVEPWIMSDEGLFINPQEHGLVRPVINGRPRFQKWPKLRGSPAAWLVLSLAHMVHLGLEALFSVGLEAAFGRLDLVRAVSLLLSAGASVPLLARAVGAPSLGSLTTLRLPSVFVAALVCEEVVAALLGARVGAWRAAGIGRFLRVAVATPLAEEVYFRVALLHLCANRMTSAFAACVLAGFVFASLHSVSGFWPMLLLFVAGCSLSLRFVASGRNFAEALLHCLHNAAAMASVASKAPDSGASSQQTAELVPLLLFSGMLLFDAVKLGMLPGQLSLDWISVLGGGLSGQE